MSPEAQIALLGWVFAGALAVILGCVAVLVRKGRAVPLPGMWLWPPGRPGKR